MSELNLHRLRVKTDNGDMATILSILVILFYYLTHLTEVVSTSHHHEQIVITID